MSSRLLLKRFLQMTLILLSPWCWGLQQGFNLTEYGHFIYDASEEQKTEAQSAVDQAKSLGANHIELNVRARMIGPYSNEIIPAIPAQESANELKRMKRLMDYIHAQNMTVGIRPIFFVVGPQGEFPYQETRSDGSKITWWHGNIQPSNPTQWFISFQNYLDRYLLVAKLGRADSFTLGAELYSMTVGIEDQWLQNPYGFPQQWLALLRYAKAKLASVKTKIAYDINFTDDSNIATGGVLKSGGELERWRYRLVDLANPVNPVENETWQNLVQFWKELDVIGVDMYRSLASPEDKIPADYDSIVNLLVKRAQVYAEQLDYTLLEIQLTLDIEKTLVFKEVGFRSVENGFINPFGYVSEGGLYSDAHQAAGYKALFETLWTPGFTWMGGINFWDIPIDPRAHGPNDLGFSPLGKEKTTAEIKKYWTQP